MLRFLLYLLIAYFVLRALGRFFVVSTFSNLNKKMNDQMRKKEQDQAAMPEGHVSVDPNPGTKERRGNGSDEFTDYEEVQ